MKDDIPKIYRTWDQNVGDRYAYYQPDIRFHTSEREWLLSSIFRNRYGGKLTNLRILDIGCGYGGVLSRLTEWGATPKNITGVELLEDRISTAKERCPDGIHWHHGSVESLATHKAFDIILSFTVYSSISENQDRNNLLEESIRRLTPDGIILIYDIRYNNPRNKNVRKLSPKDISEFQPKMQIRTRKLGLLPPITRFLSPRSYLATHLISTCLRPLRSHYMFELTH